ncbi:MAG: ATP phosphoribosyltransferase, partial [Candidatus Nanopelagicaceae bacterium]
GRDLLIDSQAPAVEVLPLDFGQSSFRFAAPSGSKWNLEDISGKRIATAYPGLVNSYLKSANLSAQVVRLDGAVESSVRLGVADLIADVVSTGNTLRQAGLEMFGEPILKSEAILIKRDNATLPVEFETLQRRLSGVVIARQYVLLDYDIEKKNLTTACALTPGLESPTISPLAKEDWAAVRAMVPRKDTNRVMDELWAIGARGILVTDIHACRL